MLRTLYQRASLSSTRAAPGAFVDVLPLMRVQLNYDGLDTKRTISWTDQLNMSYTGSSTRPEFTKRPDEAQAHLKDRNA